MVLLAVGWLAGWWARRGRWLLSLDGARCRVASLAGLVEEPHELLVRQGVVVSAPWPRRRSAAVSQPANHLSPRRSCTTQQEAVQRHCECNAPNQSLENMILWRMANITPLSLVRMKNMTTPVENGDVDPSPGNYEPSPANLPCQTTHYLMGCWVFPGFLFFVR